MESKRFNTLETIKIFLEYPEIMFQAVQRMDKNGEHFIRETELASKVLAHAEQLKSEDSQRLCSAFAIDNLFHANLLADKEKCDGDTQLIFQSVIIDLFRLCDASLYQKLTDAKLRSKLVSIRDTRDRLETASFLDSDPDFTELIDDLWMQLNDLSGLLRTNILNMQRLSTNLENISADASKTPEQFIVFRQELFNKISTLFERHIRPTLNFLNPKIRLDDGTNLFETLDDIKLKFDSHNKVNLANQVFRFSISFGKKYQPIHQVAREVDHFLNKTRVGMLQFNAMEYYYQKLLKDYKITQERNLNRKWLDGKEFISSTRFILCLKEQRNRPKEYRFGDSSSYFANLFAEIEQRLSIYRNENFLPKIIGRASYQEHAAAKLERTKKILKLIEVMPLLPTQDLTAVLHYFLMDSLEDYTFSDLLMAVIHLTRQNSKHYKVMITNHFSYVTLGDEFYVYRRRRVELLSME